jgi:4-hydroxy-3-methylbut-2-enyl diphosphate reductase
VVGTRGEAPEAIQVVESPADIANLKIIDPNKLVYLTQTTLSTDDADVIIKALKATFPNLKEPPSSDICYATTNRQRAVRAIAPDADLVLVVGSRNSSNSVRLTEISQNVGTNARLIDDKSELKPEWFDGVKTVLITAGASAPEDLVHDLIVELIERYGGEVEQRDVYHEEVEFGLPGTLKDLMRKRGTDPAHRKVVRQDSGPLLHAWLEERGIQHRTVDLTIGATN